jgi:predicted metal-dependent peptidase
VTLTVCDAEVHGLRKIRKLEEALAMMKGGGGTDMRPAFAQAMDARPRPEVIICITDGLVGDGVPVTAPQGVKVVWVLVGRHRQIPVNWGEVIEVEPAAPLRAA